MLIGILSLFVNTEGKKKDYYMVRQFGAVDLVG